MAGPALRHREDPGRTAARVRREAHGRGVERGGRPRGVDDAFLRIVRSEPGYALSVGAWLHDSGDRIRTWDREDPARDRRRRRREDDREGCERDRDPPAPRPTPEGTDRREPRRRTGLHPRTRVSP